MFGAEVNPNQKAVADGKEHPQFRWRSFQEALGLLKWSENSMGFFFPKNRFCSLQSTSSRFLSVSGEAPDYLSEKQLRRGLQRLQKRAMIGPHGAFG
jgi:hypothetical protein